MKELFLPDEGAERCDPDLEARLVALILGEASGFEAEALERLMKEQPAVAAAKRRLELLHGVVGAAVQPDDSDWRLSPQRRSLVMATLGIGRDGNGESMAGAGEDVARESRVRAASRKVLWAAAACVMINVILFGWLVGQFGAKDAMIQHAAPSVVSYDAIMDEADADLNGATIVDSSGFESRLPRSLLGSASSEEGRLARRPSKQPAASPSAPSPAAVPPSPPVTPDQSLAEGEKDRGRRSLAALRDRIGSAQETVEPVPDPFGEEAEDPFSADAPASRPTPRRTVTATKAVEKGKIASGKVPTPELTNEPSLDFGSGDDFGGGWGYRGKDTAKKEAPGRQDGSERAAPAQERDAKILADGERMAFQPSPEEGGEAAPSVGDALSVADDRSTLHFEVAGRSSQRGGMVDQKPGENKAEGAVDLLKKGRKAYAEGNYDQAVEKYKESLAAVPGGPATESQRKAIVDHLADGQVALAQQQRRTGRYEEAREQLEEALTLAPENEYAQRELKNLDDPIRSNSGLSFDRNKEIDQLRGNLSGAESYKKLGLYDEATREYQKALRSDPHNSEARQGMEQIQQLKSDYYRSAYDETRARLLSEVDHAWDLAVPPGETKGMPAPAKPGDRAGSGVAADETVAAGARLGPGEAEEIQSRTFKVPPTFLSDISLGGGAADDAEADPFADGDSGVGGGALMARRPLKEILQESGLDFPPGATVEYFPATGELVVRNTSANLELVDQLTESLAMARESEEEPPGVPEESAVEEREIDAKEEPFSTFSLHVSDVSFKLATASLAQGQWPAPGDLRVEEFVNAFDYGDPAPSQAEKVICRLEQAAHPFMQQRNLLRIGLRTAALGRAGGTPLRLTVLLDHSGSMERLDRAESVQRAFDLLAEQLTERDQITLISFARTPRLLADRLPGSEAGALAALVAATPSGGGTNLEEALQLGLSKALEQKIEGGQNRVILLTDGAANLGNARPQDLAKMVERLRQAGIAFDACGVGAKGLNDQILESLTRKGDGRYYFLDRPEDADAGFARQIAGALRPAAKNVKVQVEFNPRRVGHYKLYGFDKHRLETEDFRDDGVDAAELAAEEAGNAIYHVEVRPEGEGAIGTISVRFEDMETRTMVERSWIIPYGESAPRLSEAMPSMRLAGSAALLGEKLNGSAVGERVRMGELVPLVNSLRSDYPASERVAELVEMAQKARALEGE